MSSTKITWRNHYIPQFILKNFLDYSYDKNGKIYICDKTLGINQTIDKRNSETTGYVEHLYSIKNSKGNPVDTIEKFLEKYIDTPMSKIVKKIINNNHILLTDTSNFRYLNIEKNEIDILIEFFAYQKIRTPSYFNLTGQTKHIIDSLIDDFNGLDINSNKEFKRNELIPYIFNKNNLKHFKNFFESYFYFIIVNFNSNFLLGDTGIITRQFLFSKNEVYYPISPRISIVGVPKKFLAYHNDPINFFNQNVNINNYITDINTCTKRDAHQFIYSNKSFSFSEIESICSYISPSFNLDSGSQKMNKFSPHITHTSLWKKNKYSHK